MRIEGIDPARAEGDLATAFKTQVEEWGTPLVASRVLGRRPSIYNGLQALSSGVQASGLLSVELKALVNRRVASHNGCSF